MGQALYRKYRSKSLAEIVGQEHITETLKRAIESGRISHAYLFTGPRGVGKTSIARILAHELNGVPYNGEDNHLDIIEIDAASSGGVDEVRDLRDKVYIAPSSGKYKVYIIDEVHMMTTAAFNALLKTLEEPPAHAVFILATTEAHKLPATIISRTQRFTFKPITREKVVKHLRNIAEQEKIDITDEALELIAEHGEGSFRDSISMLDQASSAGARVDRTTVEQLLGVPPRTIVDKIISDVGGHDTAHLLDLLSQLKSGGYQAAGVARQLGQSLRAQLVNGTAVLGNQRTIAVLRRLIDVPPSHNPDQLLELVLIEASLDDTGMPAAAVKTESVAHAPSKPVADMKPPEPQPVDDPSTKPTPTSIPHQAPKPEPKATSAKGDEPGTSDITITSDVWLALMESLKKQYNTLYGIIRMAQPEFTPGKVTLTFGYAFHQKRANDAKNKKILTATLEEITGQQIVIDCHYDKNVTPPTPAIIASAAPGPQNAASLGAISNIFGGGEVIST